MSSAASERESPSQSNQELGPEESRAAERRVASLQSPILFFEAKHKILELLEVFAEHGYISLEDVAARLDRSSDLVSSKEFAALRERVTLLESELKAEKATRQLAEWELEEATATLEGERTLVRDCLARIASLEGKLREARRTTVKLIAASRNSLATLKKVRSELAPETFAQNALNPIVQDFQQMAQAVQELHAIALVKTVGEPLPPPSP
jgi:chromosome segregation ATPase